MFKADDFVPCGHIIKTHGYKGAVKAAFSEHFIPEFEKGDWLFINFNEKPVPFFIQEVTYPGDELPVFKLEDINTPEVAQKLLERKITIPKNGLSGEEPIAILGLKGYDVYDQDKQYQGTIKEVSEQTGQFLLTLENADRRSYLIPCHPDLILELNDREKWVAMELPEGIDSLVNDE